MSDEETTLVAAEATQSSQGRSLPERELSPDTLPRGSSIGRYVVLGVLGHGAMGVVLVAYDPDLDRRVALKLLREVSDGGSVGRALLLREAQAMARLNHPNVVTVHDVGEHESRVYIAMELVEGVTARAWQCASPRAWQDIVAVYRQAGAGLAAAHAAGLVHRDFKPDNVLVAEDGRVLVTDFGLARVELDPTTFDAAPRGSGALLELTRTGTLAGTPAYMAPEQLAGRTADARSDQFAFCVAMFEALHGTRPFVASSLPELARAVTEGEVHEPESPVGPGWLRAAIRRGLAVDPSARHPSMRALLELLARDPSRARRRWAAAVGGALVATAFVASAALPEGESRMCRAGEEHVAQVWHAERAATIEAAFAATSIPHAASTWASARERFEAWGPAWADAHRDACEATHVRGEQSGARLDARMTCLQEQLDHVDALLLELAHPDDALLERTASATAGLPRPSTCADPSGPALPEDPATRERIAEARRSLTTARARNDLGRFASGIDAAVEASALAEGDAPVLVAEALTLEAQLRHRAGDATAADATLRRALQAAVLAGDHVSEAEAWLELLFITASTRALPQDAVLLLLPAELACERSGRDDLRRRFHDVAGVALMHAGRYDESIAHHRQAIELVSVPGIAEATRGVVHANYGNTLYEHGRYQEALEQFESALASSRRAFGEDHPTTATDLFNLARALGAMAEYDRSRALYEEAIGIREAALGPEHRVVAEGRLNFGLILARQGKRDEGKAQIERALAIWSATLEPDHPYLGIAHNNLGTIAHEQGRLDDALAEFREAEAIATRRFGDTSIRIVAPLLNQALVLTDREDYDTALAAFDRAIELNAELLRPDHPDAAYPLVGKAKTLVEMGRPAEAVPLLEHALRLREAGHREPAEMYLTYYLLAQALWNAGLDRPRAIELGRKAREAFVQTGLDFAESDGLEQWLAEHAAPEG